MAFANIESTRIPQVTFHARKDDSWVGVTSDALFSNKTVILFALPGAFTPTCSSSHLPRYNELAPTFFENGVDEIVCLSVNDTFVMNAWLADQEAENITVVPDGNGDFTRAMGMLVNKGELGFGQRSWRYSMLVRDGVIEKMFIEPEQPGDPFEVSDADTMMHFINPNAKSPSSVTVITKPGCPFCARAKQLLIDKGIRYEEVVLGQDATSVSLKAISGQTTVPQVFIDGKHVGDSEQLERFIA